MKKILFTLTIALSLTGCTKWLDEEPKQIAESVFYSTPTELEAAVNAVLLPLRQAREAQMANYIATLECHSDWMVGRGSWEPLGLYQGLNDVNITRIQGFWDAFYVGVRNANLVIRNAVAGNSISQEQVDQYVSEARFLRAYLYYQLVQNWGGVPLRIESNMDLPHLPRSSSDDVYALIVEDLLSAENQLPPTASISGRPTRWAAKTLLAEVFLQLQRYPEAAERADQVIAQGGYTLESVASVQDIQNRIFGPDIISSSEEIFALKYARLEDQGNYLLWISNHPASRLFTPQGIGAYAVHGNASNPNYVNWDDRDLRKGLWDRIDYGNAPNALISSKYVDPQAISQYAAGNDQPIFRLSDALLLYAEAAVRAEGSVSPAALEALNKVHRRAYGHNPGSPSEDDLDIEPFNPESFIDRVVRERGYEFIFEGKRWLELKRLGKVDELINYAKGLAVVERHLLWPIPNSEFNYNNAIDPSTDQNPGY